MEGLVIWFGFGVKSGSSVLESEQNQCGCQR